MPGICVICNHLMEYFKDLMFFDKYFNRLLKCPKCKSVFSKYPYWLGEINYKLLPNSEKLESILNKVIKLYNKDTPSIYNVNINIPKFDMNTISIDQEYDIIVCANIIEKMYEYYLHKLILEMMNNSRILIIESLIVENNILNLNDRDIGENVSFLTSMSYNQIINNYNNKKKIKIIDNKKRYIIIYDSNINIDFNLDIN